MTSPSESTELYQKLTDALFGATSNGAAVNKQMVDTAYAILAQEYSRGRREALKELLEFAYDPANGRATIITYLETKLKEPSND